VKNGGTRFWIELFHVGSGALPPDGLSHALSHALVTRVTAIPEAEIGRALGPPPVFNNLSFYQLFHVEQSTAFLNCSTWNNLINAGR
jgi:hypothetical protein